MLNIRRILMVLVTGLGLSLVTVPSPAQAGTRLPPTHPGYWLAGSDGGVFAFNAPFYGSGRPSTAQPDSCGFFPPPSSYAFDGCAAISAVPDGSGYWMLNVARSPIPFGQAGPQPPVGGCTTLNDGHDVSPGYFVGVASSSTGKGYWLVTSLGLVFGCGDVQAPVGGPTSVRIPGAVVAIAGTPSGRGYWVVASDGGVFAFGDAAFAGSMGGRFLNAPIAGFTPTPDGMGYWLVASDGGVFSFGDAPYVGSMGGTHLSAPVVGIAGTPDGGGYWLAAADGGVFSFGSAPFEGSMGGMPMAGPVVGIATYRGSLPV